MNTAISCYVITACFLQTYDEVQENAFRSDENSEAFQAEKDRNREDDRILENEENTEKVCNIENEENTEKVCSIEKEGKKTQESPQKKVQIGKDKKPPNVVYLDQRF